MALPLTQERSKRNQGVCARVSRRECRRSSDHRSVRTKVPGKFQNLNYTPALTRTFCATMCVFCVRTPFAVPRRFSPSIDNITVTLWESRGNRLRPRACHLESHHFWKWFPHPAGLSFRNRKSIHRRVASDPRKADSSALARARGNRVCSLEIPRHSQPGCQRGTRRRWLSPRAVSEYESVAATLVREPRRLLESDPQLLHDLWMIVTLLQSPGAAHG